MLLYPQDFFDFANGVDIEDEQIVEWLNEVLTYLTESERDFDMQSISSGNTTVIGFKRGDQYQFLVCKNFKEAILTENDIKEFNIQE